MLNRQSMMASIPGQIFGAYGNSLFGRLGLRAQTPAPVQPAMQAPQTMAQPEFKNDFVYKRPSFGMQRQMNSPSMNWRLGN